MAIPGNQYFIKKHFNSLTPANELKPDSILNQQGCQQNGNNVNFYYTSDEARPFLFDVEDNKSIFSKLVNTKVVLNKSLLIQDDALLHPF